MKERTMIIIKPDAVNRTIVGEIISRFERKGLKIVGMKMSHLDEETLGEHYSHHRGKPFYKGLVRFMMTCPSLLMVVEGNHAIDVARKISGETHGAKALPGTIRGDYSLSTQCNIVHASDSLETAKKEIKRFFKENELFDYNRIDTEMIYSEEER